MNTNQLIICVIEEFDPVYFVGASWVTTESVSSFDVPDYEVIIVLSTS